MEIYIININKKKFSQYKTYNEALDSMDSIIKSNPNFTSNIEIILEEFCEYGHSDTCCKIYLLCEYKNLVFTKYL